MTIELSRFIHAPIDQVFAFFDDPANTLPFNEHVISFQVIDEHADGRRAVDVVMGAGERRWMQTIGQVVREPPTRLVTRSGTWEAEGDPWVATLVTDRRFVAEGGGTRLDVEVEFRVANPWRHPMKVIQNWIQRDAVRPEFEQQLDAMVRRIERVPEPDRPPRHEPPG